MLYKALVYVVLITFSSNEFMSLYAYSRKASRERRLIKKDREEQNNIFRSPEKERILKAKMAKFWEQDLDTLIEIADRDFEKALKFFEDTHPGEDFFEKLRNDLEAYMLSDRKLKIIGVKNIEKELLLFMPPQVSEYFRENNTTITSILKNTTNEINILEMMKAGKEFKESKRKHRKLNLPKEVFKKTLSKELNAMVIEKKNIKRAMIAYTGNLPNTLLARERISRPSSAPTNPPQVNVNLSEAEVTNPHPDDPPVYENPSLEEEIDEMNNAYIANAASGLGNLMGKQAGKQAEATATKTAGIGMIISGIAMIIAGIALLNIPDPTGATKVAGWSLIAAGTAMSVTGVMTLNEGQKDQGEANSQMAEILKQTGQIAEIQNQMQDLQEEQRQEDEAARKIQEYEKRRLLERERQLELRRQLQQNSLQY